MADNIVCIGGNKYRIVDDGSPTTPVNAVDMSVTEQKLSRLVDIAGGGNLLGSYRSIKIEIPPREKAWEVSLGINATQFNIRCDQAVTMTLNTSTGDNIFIEATEFPFSVSNLSINQSIHTVYITTGDNLTTVKILAFGLVGR